MTPPRCPELGLNPGQTQTKLVPGVKLGHETWVKTNASTLVKIKQAANKFKKNLEESKKDDKKGMEWGPRTLMRLGRPRTGPWLLIFKTSKGVLRNCKFHPWTKPMISWIIFPR